MVALVPAPGALDGEAEGAVELAGTEELEDALELAVEEPPDDPHAVSASMHEAIAIAVTRTFQRKPMRATSLNRCRTNILYVLLKHASRHGGAGLRQIQSTKHLTGQATATPHECDLAS